MKWRERLLLLVCGADDAQVQAIARWVAPPVEQDGVAAAIEEFIL